MENFRSEITLKNKTSSDLKSDLRNPLLSYNLCISMEFLFFVVSAIHNYV